MKPEVFPSQRRTLSGHVWNVHHVLETAVGVGLTKIFYGTILWVSILRDIAEVVGGLKWRLTTKSLTIQDQTLLWAIRCHTLRENHL